jgi:uncharacterized protein (DUF2225 family)
VCKGKKTVVSLFSSVSLCVYTVEKYKEKKLCYIAAELLNHERALRAIKATWIYSWKKKKNSSNSSGEEEGKRRWRFFFIDMVVVVVG